MTRIETLSDLRRAWKTIMRTFNRDLALAARMAADPVATLQSMGYDVSAEAEVALKKATH